MSATRPELARAAGDVPLGGYVLASMSLQVLAQSETLLGQAYSDDGDPTWIDFFTHARLAADATEIHRNCRCRTW